MNNEASLSRVEQRIIAGVLIAVVVLIGMDLISDSQDGASWAHLGVEMTIALVAIFGIFVLIRSSFYTKKELRMAHKNIEAIQQEAAKWKEESQKHIEGLSNAIDAQLARWELSPSEKEVALLLLKGLSLKEVADLRQTTEKTARAQSAAIYQKSGLAGRSELSAFFLEDLLSPGGNTKT